MYRKTDFTEVKKRFSKPRLLESRIKGINFGGGKLSKTQLDLAGSAPKSNFCLVIKNSNMEFFNDNFLYFLGKGVQITEEIFY